MNTLTTMLAWKLAAVDCVILSRHISMNSGSLKALHVRVDGDIYKRIAKKSGK